MGGTSKTSQTQSSTTAPWEAAQPALQGILGQLSGQLGNTGITGAETNALNSISANGQNQFAPQINALATQLFGGGGATAQAGNIQSGLDTFKSQMQPYTAAPTGEINPALRAQLDTILSDVTGSVNGQFAAAGRDMSGMNSQTLARGYAQGAAPVIANQYNTDVDRSINASKSIYDAQNNTSGLLSGLNQQDIANKTAGVGVAQAGTDAATSGARATLEAEAARRGIPIQTLGLLAQIGIPIAGLGSQSTGQSTGTQQMSGAQQFGLITGGLANLFGGGGNTTFANIGRSIFSDIRLKQDVEQVGTLFDGTPVYRYRYTGQPAFQIGLMAHEVEDFAPDAVATIGGYKAVDYKLATDKALERR